MLLRKRAYNHKGGYSVETAQSYVDTTGKFYLLTVSDQPRFVYQEGQRTDQVDSYYYWILAEDGDEPFRVKVTKKLANKKQFQLVTIVDLQACEINRQNDQGFRQTDVYFKAAEIV